jgi:diguanylate cyclase (GGDEF)-like protein
MIPDVVTLWMVISLTHLLFGMLHLLVSVGKRRNAAVLLWSAGNISGFVGAGLISARGYLPDTMSITVASGMVAAAWGLMWSGQRAFDRLPIHWPALAAGPTFLWAVFALPLPFSPANPATRVSLVGLVLAGYFVLSVVDAIKAGRTERLVSRRLLMGVYIIATSATITHIIGVHLHGVAGRGVESTPFAAISVLIFAFSVIAINLCLSLMGWERLEDQLADAAMLDSLTGTLNRVGFMIQAQRLAEDCVARQLRCSIIVMDLDEFKATNDLFGHDAGDRLLAEFALVARSNLRSGDLLARVGGEEFCAALPGADELQAAVIADRLRVAYSASKFTHHDAVLTGTVSIGVSQIGHKAGLRSAIHRADVAMYEAKSRGRDRVIRASVAGGLPLPDESLIESPAGEEPPVESPVDEDSPIESPIDEESPIESPVAGETS